jgi:type VI secretion system protein ImpA
MPTEPVIDLPSLLAPIPGESPSGVFLRASSPEFAQIAELLPQVDKAVAESIEDKAKPGDWSGLLKLTSGLLRTKTKDLRIASRLTQALIRLYGFAGLRDGLQLLIGLMNEYWETVYPLPDEEDQSLDSRVSPLVALCLESEAPVWVRDIPIATEKAVSSENDNIKVPATLNLYNLIYEAKSDKAAQFKSSLANVIVKTPPAFYLKQAGDVLEAKETLKQFNDCANGKFGHDVAPDVSKLKDALESCYARIATICKDRNISLVAVAAAAGADDPVAAGGGSVPDSYPSSVSSNGHSGPISNRGEALAKLREIAEFLKRAEPHSPVSYLINRAIAWSEMPFEKLLLELVTDDQSRAAINTTLGIKPDDGSGGYGGYNSGGGYGDGSSEPPPMG